MDNSTPLSNLPTAQDSLEAESPDTARPWTTNRQFAEKVQDMYVGTEFQKYANRIETCASLLRFSDAVDSQTGECKLKLKTAFFCKVRHCPVCTWRRSLKLKAKFYQRIPDIIANYPTHRFLFLTLTVKNTHVNDLGAALTEMSEAWNRLAVLPIFKKAVKGYVKSIEVTKQEGVDFAHPHYHVLLHVEASYFGNKYIKQQQWRELWMNALKADYLPHVNIKRIKPRDDRTDIESAILEVLKYSVKPSDLVESPEFLIGLTKQTHRRQFVSCSGTLKNVIKEKEMNTELTEDAEKLINVSNFEKAYVWNTTTKHYKRSYRHDREV